MADKQEELDPALYQYDEIYDQIKGEDKRERSREKEKEREKRKEEKPRQSKYIGRMKQMVSDRHKDHEVAYERKIARDNAKLGVDNEMVFVTESYLKKKEEEKEAARLKKAEEEKAEREAPEKGSYVDFKKKMLEQSAKNRK